jgi:hypothetical protein
MDMSESTHLSTNPTRLIRFSDSPNPSNPSSSSPSPCLIKVPNPSISLSTLTVHQTSQEEIDSLSLPHLLPNNTMFDSLLNTSTYSASPPSFEVMPHFSQTLSPEFIPNPQLTPPFKSIITDIEDISDLMLEPTNCPNPPISLTPTHTKVPATSILETNLSKASNIIIPKLPPLHSKFPHKTNIRPHPYQLTPTLASLRKWTSHSPDENPYPSHLPLALTNSPTHVTHLQILPNEEGVSSPPSIP